MDRFDVHDSGTFSFCFQDIIFGRDSDCSSAGVHSLLPEGITDFRKPKRIRKGTDQGKRFRKQCFYDPFKHRKGFFDFSRVFFLPEKAFKHAVPGIRRK